MKYRLLGKTDLSVSAVGLGSWALGGGTDWGPTSFEDAQATVSAALDNGINFIDTAPIYGESENVLGRILAGKRNQIFLATKCGLVKNGSWTDHDLRPQTITAQLETSLQNLHTDYIDVYFIHYPDPNVPWQTVLETLAKCKQQGKIRFIGTCNTAPDLLREMAQTGLISCVQDEFSLLHPAKGQAALQICREYNLGFVAYGTLCGGILSGKYRQEPNLRRADARNYFYKCYKGACFTSVQNKVQQVREVAERQNISASETSTAWVLAQPGVTCALTGARSAAQIVQNARAAHVVLSPEELCTLPN